mmetsp:Transcript_26220/g.39679  ORF Transcript_26220/g.39679 Transcript_26220/m.39679 type:complete len:98 (+) Transcript_26220:23-316(+)
MILVVNVYYLIVTEESIQITEGQRRCLRKKKIDDIVYLPSLLCILLEFPSYSVQKIVGFECAVVDAWVRKLPIIWVPDYVIVNDIRVQFDQVELELT